MNLVYKQAIMPEMIGGEKTYFPKKVFLLNKVIIGIARTMETRYWVKDKFLYEISI